ncbi:hypothetical protein VD0002_g9104 [Verticillium dahliae]|nr:hypothetical protein VdG2_00199 [Verticillium dahliae VDG2]KAF3353458.1 Trans-1,2-dihydrobenzene-1,2-diol dehydrogenase [Verticillium dahliae VDG1]KAH6708083.1 DUF250 domain membrane protein [Verticillium dahliae]PNH56770.1 hypothetical protein VD0003_g980 [Verticillium dahliae]PNH58426.1 hypothetical protein VD0002_g9104 [Verticillium dahliae]
MAYSPLPVTEDAAPPPAPAPAGSTLQTAIYMVLWIISSNFTILFNKYLIDTIGFGYPILLTCWHLVFAAVVTQILARTTTLLDSRHQLPISGRFFIRTILPIGIVSSGSLVCSNVVYLYLSVAFIQMLKAASPVAVLFTSWAMGVADPTMTAIVNVLCIVAGVGLASAGEVDMSMIGTVIQLAGIMFEALRVVLIQKMLSNEGLKMDALVGLYYYAPVCAVMNLVVGAALEMPHFKYEDLERAGFMMLILNAAVALLLNFTSMVLIGKTSGLVTTLTGIFKNILLIGCSVLFWHTKISTIQVVGYSVSLAGLIHYSFGTEKILGALKGALAMVTGAVGAASVSGEKFRPSRRMRIGLVIAFITLLSICIFLAYMRHIEASPLEWVWSTTGGTV